MLSMVEARELGYASVQTPRACKRRNGTKRRGRLKTTVTYERQRDEEKTADMLNGFVDCFLGFGHNVEISSTDIVLAESPAIRTEEQTCPAVENYIAPLAYLRSIWAIIWGTICHPFSTTIVDLSTGEAVTVPFIRMPIDESGEESA